MVLFRVMFVLILVILAAATSAQPLATSFRSGGIEIPAFLQRSDDVAPRAVVINVHGNPGGKIRAESSLATLLEKQGIATFWFNYRGIWGNLGTYSVSNGVGDARAAIEFLKSTEAKQRFGLGDSPIILHGYSMGSAIAVLGAAGNDSVAGVVAVAPCDHGYFGRERVDPQSRIKQFLDEAAEGLFGPNGPVPGGGPAFMGDLVANHQSYGFPRNASSLQKTALLFFPALDDETCPIEDHFLPLYRALRSAKHPRLEAFGLNAGHGLDSASGNTMRQMTADWIVRTFPFALSKVAAPETSISRPAPARR